MDSALLVGISLCMSFTMKIFQRLYTPMYWAQASWKIFDKLKIQSLTNVRLIVSVIIIFLFFSLKHPTCVTDGNVKDLLRLVILRATFIDILIKLDHPAKNNSTTLLPTGKDLNGILGLEWSRENKSNTHHNKNGEYISTFVTPIERKRKRVAALMMSTFKGYVWNSNASHHTFSSRQEVLPQEISVMNYDWMTATHAIDVYEG